MEKGRREKLFSARFIYFFLLLTSTNIHFCVCFVGFFLSLSFTVRILFAGGGVEKNVKILKTDMLHFDDDDHQRDMLLAAFFEVLWAKKVFLEK